MSYSPVPARTRPFRYAGFWSLAACLALSGPHDGPLRAGFGIAFCLLWPPLVDWLSRRLARRQAAEPGRRGDGQAMPRRRRYGHAAYPVESAVVATVLVMIQPPLLAGFTTLLCLLAGASALGGWRLLVASALSLVPALGLQLALAAGTAAPWPAPSTPPAADLLALAMLLVFAVALAQVSYRQAMRLASQRRSLAERSMRLERLAGRMQRYLPPSLRTRLTAAPDAPCRWERRWLTVVFVDLVGFTELSERLDAEPLARLLDDCLGTLIPQVERRGGEVSKLLGDGLLALFDGDQRQPAARAALAFCGEAPGRLQQLAERWRAAGEPVALQLRAGVASGYCTMGDRGGADRLDFTLVGPPVNLASRLQGQADIDGTLMDLATAALAGVDRRPDAVRRVRLRGLGEIPAYPLDRVGDGGDASAPEVARVC